MAKSAILLAMPATISQGVKLDAQTRERLQALAKRRDRSPHYLMKTAIESFLDREEACEREKQEDHERYEQYLLTGEAISQEKTGAWLQSLAVGQMAPRPQ